MSEDQTSRPESWGDFRAMVAGPGAKVPKARTVPAARSMSRRPQAEGRPPGKVRPQDQDHGQVTAEFKKSLAQPLWRARWHCRGFSNWRWPNWRPRADALCYRHLRHCGRRHRRGACCRYGFAAATRGLTVRSRRFSLASLRLVNCRPAVAVRLFRTGRGWLCLWGVPATLIASVALLANLRQQLGAIAGRADRPLPNARRQPMRARMTVRAGAPRA